MRASLSTQVQSRAPRAAPRGEKVTLHTGSGQNGNGDLYWGSGRAVWNNGGDTIIVTTADGEEVVRKKYSGRLQRRTLS